MDRAALPSIFLVPGSLSTMNPPIRPPVPGLPLPESKVRQTGWRGVVFPPPSSPEKQFVFDSKYVLTY